MKNGSDEEECKLNAKLAISIARKLGALIFLVPEDIVELRQRLILTFVASLSMLKLRRTTNMTVSLESTL